MVEVMPSTNATTSGIFNNPRIVCAMSEMADYFKNIIAEIENQKEKESVNNFCVLANNCIQKVADKKEK